MQFLSTEQAHSKIYREKHSNVAEIIFRNNRVKKIRSLPYYMAGVVRQVVQGGIYAQISEIEPRWN